MTRPQLIAYIAQLHGTLHREYCLAYVPGCVPFEEQLATAIIEDLAELGAIRFDADGGVIRP